MEDAHFMDFSSIHLEPDERPEDLDQRFMVFIEDSLLFLDGGTSHRGEDKTEDEELSQIGERFENRLIPTVYPGKGIASRLLTEHSPRGFQKE